MWLHVTKAVSVTLMLAITCVAIAQEPTRAELPYLVEYDNSPDLPNGIAFYMTLLTLDHFHTESGGVDSAAWVAQELELSDVDSHSFVSQALTTLSLINADVTAQLTRHSCQFAGAEVSKKNKYAALQQTYDIHTAIYDHYYDQLKAGLDSDAGERLHGGLTSKSSILVIMRLTLKRPIGELATIRLKPLQCYVEDPTSNQSHTETSLRRWLLLAGSGRRIDL